MYNALAVPILLCGSEIWTLRKEDKNIEINRDTNISEEQPECTYLITKEMQKVWKS